MAQTAQRQAKSSRPAPVGRSPWPIVLTLIGLVVVAAVVAYGATALGKKTGADRAVAQTGTVATSGAALSPSPDSGADQAIGQAAPTLQGHSFDGDAVQIGDDGKPKLVMFIAHWCPHCQKEVPIISDWIEAGKAPQGVDVYAVATATSSSSPNYPPSAWLDSVDWPVTTMADSAANEAALAFGVTGYPTFVAVGADGTVKGRTSGELSMDALGQFMQLAL